MRTPKGDRFSRWFRREAPLAHLFLWIRSREDILDGLGPRDGEGKENAENDYVMATKSVDRGEGLILACRNFPTRSFLESDVNGTGTSTVTEKGHSQTNTHPNETMGLLLITKEQEAQEQGERYAANSQNHKDVQQVVLFLRWNDQ